MNSPFRVRLRNSRPPGFRLAPSPASRPSRSSPSFRLGVQKYIFFLNRQTFSQKFFEKFFPRGSRPLCLPRPPRSRETGPQKYCFFPFRQTFFQEIFEKIFNKLAFNTVTARGFPSPPHRNGTPGRETRPRHAPPRPRPRWKRRESLPRTGITTAPDRQLPPPKKNRGAEDPKASRAHNSQTAQPYFAIRIRASTATTCLALPNRGLISIS